MQISFKKAFAFLEQTSIGPSFSDGTLSDAIFLSGSDATGTGTGAEAGTVAVAGGVFFFEASAKTVF